MLSAIVGGVSLLVGCLIGYLLFGRVKKPIEPVAPILPDSTLEAEPVEKADDEEQQQLEQERQDKEKEQQEQLTDLQGLVKTLGVRIEELETDIRRYRRRASEHLDQLTDELCSRWRSHKFKTQVLDLPDEVDASVVSDLDVFAAPMRGWMKDCGLGSAEMSYQLGLISALEQKWDEAARCFKKAAFDGKVPEGWLALGDCEWALGHKKKALQSYQKCLEKSRMPVHIFQRSAEVAISGRRFKEAVDILDKIMGRKSLPVDVFVLASRAHRELEDDEKAVSICDDGLKQHEDSVILLAGKIIPLSRSGMKDEAEACAERAVEIDPDCPETPYALGVMHTENSGQDTAISHFEDALVLRSDFPEALCGLGIIYNRRGDFKKALDCFERAVKVDSSCAEAYFNMSTSYQELRDFDRSIAAMNKAVKLNPDYA